MKRPQFDRAQDALSRSWRPFVVMCKKAREREIVYARASAAEAERAVLLLRWAGAVARVEHRE